MFHQRYTKITPQGVYFVGYRIVSLFHGLQLVGGILCGWNSNGTIKLVCFFSLNVKENQTDWNLLVPIHPTLLRWREPWTRHCEHIHLYFRSRGCSVHCTDHTSGGPAIYIIGVQYPIYYINQKKVMLGDRIEYVIINVNFRGSSPEKLVCFKYLNDDIH